MSDASALRVLAQTDVNDPIPASQLLPALSSQPFVHAPGTFNLRDLGNVPRESPGTPVFRPSFAFRSGALDRLTAEGRETLAGRLGIRRVFDLRSQTEHAGAPDPDLGPGVENVWAETDEVDAVLELEHFVDGEGEKGYEMMYLDVLKVYQPSIRAVLEHVRDRPEAPFLIHCTAGRDRTGVVAGLLMTLAGESPEAVALDFLLSRIGTEPAREQLIAFARHGTGATSNDAPGFYNLINLKATCWDAFLGGVEREYGGFDDYVVETLGFSADDLATIKGNLKSKAS